MGVVPMVTLSNGQLMPVIGMGTMSMVGPEATKLAVVEAVRAGYRHFDTSYSYGSEKALGEGIREAVGLGLIESRDEVFITTKLACGFADPSLVLEGIKASLRNLGMEYVDMYLIHIPLKLNPQVRKVPVAKEDISQIDLKGVWDKMEFCQNLGLTKAIGVSNFSPKRLQQLLSFAKIPPLLNQVEMSPLWHQDKLREFCKANDIHVTAYSPLGAVGTHWGHNKVVDSDVITQIANAKGKTSAQIALRWVYEQGVSIVAKSFDKERMRKNIDIFDWSLSEDESAKIGQLPQYKAVVFANVYGQHDVVLDLDAEL
ncbi:D-galacturonate reductase-like [Cucumis melo var. makuwa]|uniref:D-galacturonate reductase-like n=3 Tax=Cucumis melo TaxID=3656 RepID=A0A5A7SP76_CUCMM|nr:D-galacturonate reductase-like [Cucumis melo var. makuwa]KAA0032181.1 D-galacturonate reductase-like [Cucumis melo var. makuwa]